MKRSMMQLYTANSKQAVNAYLEAFNGEVISSYLNDEGGYYHCEIKIADVIFAISEVDNAEITSLNTMQFCFQYEQDEIEQIKHAFEVLKDNATIHFPIGSTDYSKLMVDFTDQFGARWCLFA